MNDTINKIKYNELKKFFQLEKEICFCKFAKSYRSVMSCTLATKSAGLFVFNLQPFFSQKLNRSYGSCENRRSSLLPAAGDVSQSRTSATQRQKFHTDDINLSGIRPWTLHRRVTVSKIFIGKIRSAGLNSKAFLKRMASRTSLQAFSLF